MCKRCAGIDVAEGVAGKVERLCPCQQYRAASGNSVVRFRFLRASRKSFRCPTSALPAISASVSRYSCSKLVFCSRVLTPATSAPTSLLLNSTSTTADFCEQGCKTRVEPGLQITIRSALVVVIGVDEPLFIFLCVSFLVLQQRHDQPLREFLHLHVQLDGVNQIYNCVVAYVCVEECVRGR